MRRRGGGNQCNESNVFFHFWLNEGFIIILSLTSKQFNSLLLLLMSILL